MSKKVYDKTLSELSDPSKLLWFLFQKIEDHKTHSFWYSIDTLHTITGYSKPAIIHAIKELENKQIITTQKKIGIQTIYTLNLHFGLYEPVNVVYQSTEITSNPELPVNVINQTSKRGLPPPVNVINQTSKRGLPDPMILSSDQSIELSSSSKGLSQNIKEQEKPKVADEEDDRDLLKKKAQNIIFKIFGNLNNSFLYDDFVFIGGFSEEQIENVVKNAKRQGVFYKNLPVWIMNGLRDYERLYNKTNGGNGHTQTEEEIKKDKDRELARIDEGLKHCIDKDEYLKLLKRATELSTMTINEIFNAYPEKNIRLIPDMSVEAFNEYCKGVSNE
jgi:hypothetical protein